MRCDDFSLDYAATVDGDVLGMRASRHLGGCLRCQAEVARYRKLRREMLGLRTATIADDDFLAELLDLLRPPAEVTRLHGGRRKAYISGIAAAATAGAAGAIVLASRIARPGLAS